MQRFGVRPEDRDSDAGGADGDGIVVEDLPCFPDHLGFLFIEAVGADGRVVREHVESDLMREFVLDDRFAVKVSLRLFTQFLDAPGAGAGDRLISAGNESLQTEFLVDREQRNVRDDRRAVRVRYDALVPLDVLGVHFRDHQRNVGIHSESGSVVNDHGASLHRRRRELLRQRAGSGRQNYIDVVDQLRFEQYLLNLLPQ